MPTIIPIIIFSIMFAITGLIGSFIMRAWRRYRFNLRRPTEKVHAKVIDKRVALSVSSNIRGRGHQTSASSRTSYFVTFEFRNGHRREFMVEANKYGLLTAEDEGELVYQGDWFLRFTRRGSNQVIESAPQKGTLVGLVIATVFMIFFIVIALFLFSKFLEFSRF